VKHHLDLDPLLRKYCEDHSTKESETLYQIERHTHLNTVKRLDVSDALQGRVISLLSHIVSPALIVEIGTFTSYATGCLAEGIKQGGKIISIERNPLFQTVIRQNLSDMGLEDIVDMRFGDALDILPTIEPAIDLLYIDGAKYEYDAYYDLTIEKVRPGGLIIADNVLWKGRVLEREMDKMTIAMDRFNKKIVADPRVSVTILPYRDGLSLIRKL